MKVLSLLLLQAVCCIGAEVKVETVAQAVQEARAISKKVLVGPASNPHLVDVAAAIVTSTWDQDGDTLAKLERTLKSSSDEVEQATVLTVVASFKTKATSMVASIDTLMKEEKSSLVKSRAIYALMRIGGNAEGVRAAFEKLAQSEDQPVRNWTITTFRTLVKEKEITDLVLIKLVNDAVCKPEVSK